MIPSIIHQTWRSRELPEPLARYCASWRRLNPRCEYRFYDDAQCIDFVQSEYPELAAFYDSLPLAIMRADLFRYLVVHRLGGLYCDVDMECLQAFDQFFAMGDAVFSIESRLTRKRQRELHYREPYQIANSIFASEAGHPFLKAMIDRAVALIRAYPRISTEMVEDITGPRSLTRLFYENRPGRLHVLQRTYWLPYGVYPRIYPFTKNMFAKHHSFGSWKLHNAGNSLFSMRRWIEMDVPPDPFPRSFFHDFRP
jgi:mannosyltransferase OCH1-like enzyme